MNELNRREFVLNDMRGSIQGAIDYNDVKSNRTVLTEYRSQAAAYRPLRVVAGHYDGDDWLAWRHNAGLDIPARQALGKIDSRDTLK